MKRASCYTQVIPKTGQPGGVSMINTNLLKGRIVAAGLTQADVAKHLGVSANTMSTKIKGKNMCVEDAEKICNLLGIVDPAERAHIFLSSLSQ